MADLVALRRELDAARDRYEMWGMVNTNGQTVEGLVDIDLNYRRAFRRLIAASRAYDKAIEEAGDGC